MILSLLIISLINADESFFTFINEVKYELASEYCPYNGVNGLSQHCQQIKLNYNNKYINNKLNNNLRKYPVQIGLGWDSVTNRVGLPIYQMTYDNSSEIYKSLSGITYLLPKEAIISKMDLASSIYNYGSYANIFDYLNYIDQSRMQGIYDSVLLSELPEILNFFGAGLNTIQHNKEVRYNMKLQLNNKYINFNNKYSNFNKYNNNDNNNNLHPYFVAVIDKLSRESNASSYDLFLRYFGTHVIVEASVGGTAEHLVALKSCYGAGIDIRTNAALYLLKTLHPEQYQNINFAAGFEQHSRASILKMRGGNISYFHPSQWDQRVKSFDDNPILIEFKTIPITDLISDLTLKNNLINHINQYIATGKQREVPFLLQYNNEAAQIRTIPLMVQAAPVHYRHGSTKVDIDPYFYLAYHNMAIDTISPVDFLTKGFVCKRIGNFAVQALYALPGGINGPVIASGCSTAALVQTVCYGGCFNVITYANCCINCIPTTDCTGGYCKFSGCNCPIF